MKLRIQTLNQDESSYKQLFQLWRAAGEGEEDIEFDFTGCSFLKQNAVAFLGGLARLIEYRGRRVEFAWDTLDEAVAANLAQNGFMEAFDGPRKSWKGNSIPFRHDPKQNAHDFANY